MTAYPVPAFVRDNIQRRVLATDRPMPCGDGIGGGRTCGTYPARLYPRGWRCEQHSTLPNRGDA